MSLSPTKQHTPHRTLSRQPSSPSLALGLPPPLPESSIMNPSTSSHSLKRSRSKPRIHRGDVSSSATSSPNNSDDEGWNGPIRSPVTVTNANETTPKRKVVGVIESPRTTVKGGNGRQTLQARLQAAAKLKKSKSTNENLKASSSFTSLIAQTRSQDLTQSQSHAQTISKKTDVFTSSAPGTGTGLSKDKVVVCVRIKPTTCQFAETAYEVTSSSLSLSDSHPNVQKRGGKAGREDEYTYSFDALLQAPARTPDLYIGRIAPLVDKAMNGYNSTIFAYGQTGSGKSFTMTGCQEELGIIPCAVDGVFDAITADPERAFLLRVSYIEIYNETLRDLLNTKKGPLRDDEKPVIHTSKGKVYVEPLVEEIVSTPQDVVELLEKGNLQRTTGATDWNERSSRSHSVFTIVIESKPRDGDSDDDVRLSRLTLIDLAGSEKAVSDLERRGEGKHINRSLLALKTVINKLTDKKSGHIPYRDSKLTHLLENALGGDSNICVICTLSAEEEHSSETLETLKFAGTCSRVETKAKKNILMSSERALIRAKDKEIEVLKRRLEGITSNVSPPLEDVTTLVESVAAMEARKSKLTTQLAKLNTQILTSELPRSGSGLPVASPKPKRRRISDFTALMGGNLGLGSPLRAPNDRRAVSNMVRLAKVSEDFSDFDRSIEEPSIQVDKQFFDNDRIISALRRGLATRDEQIALKKTQLETAMAQITELQVQLTALQRTTTERQGRQESSMQDHQAQLSEVLSRLEEKDSTICALDSSVSDLRKSREDLLLESEGRLDEVKAQLLHAVEEHEQVKTASQRELEDLRKEVTDSKQITDTLQQEKLELESQRAKAVLDFENFQQTVMNRDSEAISTLKDELAKSRKATEQAEAATASLRSQLQVRRESDGDHAQQLERLEELLKFEKEGRKMAEGDNQSLINDLATLRGLREKEVKWESERMLMTGEISRLEEERLQLVEVKATSEEAVRREREKAESALVEKAKLESQVTRLLADLVGEGDKSNALRADLAKTVEAGEMAVSKFEAQLRSETEKAEILERARDAVQEELDEVRRRLRERTSKDSDQASTITGLQDRLTAEESKTNDALMQQRQLETEIQGLRTAIMGHETEIARLSSDLEVSRKRISEQDAIIVNLEQAVTRGELEKAELQRSTTSLSSDKDAVLSSAHAKISELEVLIRAQTGAKSELQTSLRELEASHAGKVGEMSRITEELSVAMKTCETRSSELAAVRAALDKEMLDRIESEKRLKSLSTDSTKQITRITEELSALTKRHDLQSSELSEARASLVKETIDRTAAEEKLKSLSMNSTQHIDELNNVQRELTDLKIRYEEQVSCVASVKKELEQAREAIGTRTTELAALTSRTRDATAAGEATQVRLAELQQQFDIQVKSVQQLEDRLAKTTAERNGMDAELRKLSEERANSSTEATAALAEKDKLEKEVERLTAGQAASEAKVAKLNMEIDRLVAGQETLASARTASEVQVKKLQKEIDGLSAERARLSAEVVKLKKEIERLASAGSMSKAEMERLKKDAAARAASQATSEAELEKANHASKLSSTRIAESDAELGRLRGQLAQLQSSLHAAEVALTTARADSARIAEDAEKNSRELALANASGKSQQKDKVEIDRLEKVVDEQKVMIEDQREKIKFWARELEQQREIVRLLTQDPNSGSPGTPTRHSPRYGHAKSRSVVVTRYDSPAGSPAGPLGGAGSANTKVSLPSSFTARNLAMPTSPTPLPMHPSQFSNAMARKARRVTIEHDMDFLTESSKVNKAKAVFDSPDKSEKDLSDFGAQTDKEREREEKVIRAYSLKKAGLQGMTGGGARERDSFMPTSTPKQRRP